MLRRFFSTKRKSLPKAVREQVWLKDMGKEFEGKCTVDWCNNEITVFNFQVGHNIPASKGGSDKLDNLHAIAVEPEPMKQSRTRSFSLVYALMIR